MGRCGLRCSFCSRAPVAPMPRRGAQKATGGARGAVTAGAGSLGDCNGNPARCAAVNLAGGYTHTVALKSDGMVWAWGRNNYGQLGDSTTIDRLLPVQVSGLGGVPAVATG